VIFDGKIDLEVPVHQAWDFLIDINKFSACLPGIEEVKQIDDATFEGVLAAAVGPISEKFSYRSTILESRPPEQMVVRTAGTDSVTRKWGSSPTATCVAGKSGSSFPQSFSLRR
jgi:carbon monoxide dehydrogenase subunit G